MIIVRSALFYVAFFGGTFCLTIAATLVGLVAPSRIPCFAVAWGRFVVWCARVICGISLKVSGWEYLPPGPALIASRHQSAFDTVVWLTLVPKCCYVLKQELLRIPLLGRLMRRTGMIAVDRTGGATALRLLVADGARAARDGRQIVIFPEGTRAEPGQLLPLQPGVAALAIRTGLPIIPVVTDSGLRWGRRAFQKYPGTIHIMLRPPLPPGLRREELMGRLRQELSHEIHQTPRDSNNSCG